MGTHRGIPDRLTFGQWLRYRRLYRAVAEDAWRHGDPLTKQRRADLKAMARVSARYSR